MQTYNLEKLARMPWRKWQKLFVEDLCTISRQLELNWKEVKQTYSSNAKIASHLRQEAIKKQAMTNN
jgi:hypothetical protein